jgi:hypothetical protein
MSDSASPPPLETLDALQASGPIFAGIFFLMMPALFLWITSGRDAQLTCEELEPDRSFLERAALPLVALGLLFAWEGLMLLPMALFNGVVPAFGIIISGLPGGVILIGLGLLTIRVGVGLIRGERPAWLASVILLGVGTVSWAFTENAQINDSLHAAMGFSQEQRAEMTALNASPWNPRWTAAGMAATFAFALYLGRMVRPATVTE